MWIRTVGSAHEWEDHEVDLALDFQGIPLELSFIVFKRLLEELLAVFVWVPGVAFDGVEKFVSLFHGAGTDVWGRGRGDGSVGLLLDVGHGELVCILMGRKDRAVKSFRGFLLSRWVDM